MNVYLVLQHLHPDLEADKDYILKDDGDGPYILAWNAGVSKPTQEVLKTTWDAIKAVPIEQPKTELEILKETVDQLVLDNLMRGF